jgi:hypothetical protein
MTPVDRFDQSLPEILTELGRSDPAGLIDEVVSRTASMGQRPVWRQPGTWFASATAPQARVGRSALIVIAVVLLMAALLAVAMAGAFGPTPPIRRADVVLPPSPSLAASAPLTPAPTGVPDPTPTPGAPSQTTVQLGGAQPCPAMFQLLSTWQLDDPSGPVPAGRPQRTLGNDDIVFISGSPRPGGGPGLFSLGRISTGGGQPALREHADDQVFPSDPVSDGRARIVPSPDGRAVAIEEGDLGAAGCGDPLVELADGGARRPFPSGGFQRVGDLAWAPDGSALYGVRRPTIGPSGQPYYNRESGEMLDGPGTVLRWDAATGVVTELKGSCGGCGPLFVSPDGSRLATEDDGTGPGTVYVHEGDGWRVLTLGSGLVGWSDASSVVLLDGRRFGLDGSTLTEWHEPCCHETGFSGPLSPDGARIAGMTLNSDFVHYSLTILDVHDGTSHAVWTAPDSRGCTGFEAGSHDRTACEATASLSPGATLSPSDSISGYARVVAWSRDGRSVAILDVRPDTNEATLRIVPVDGSGASELLTIEIPDIASTYNSGFPNDGPAIAWLPGG